MPTTFSGDVGYRGVVKLNNTILLATGGNINLTHNPIFSSGVWGAGYANASEQVAYADNYLQLDGSMACEMTAGEGFTAVKTFAFTNRGAASGTPISILPNGEYGFTGNGWCTSLSFSSSQDSVLTCDMNWASYIDGINNNLTTGVSGNSEKGASNGILPMAFNGLYPYWATEIYGDSGTGGFIALSDIMSWTASYSSNIEFLKCCGKGTAYRGTNDSITTAPLAPDYIVLGSMTAEGSYTVFKLQGDFDPNAYHKQTKMKFVVKSPADTQGHTILLPKIVKSSGGTQIQTGSSFITADFNFSSIGDGSNPPLSLDSTEEPPKEPDPGPDPE